MPVYARRNSQSVGYENDWTLHRVGHVACPVCDPKSQPGLLITTIAQEEEGGHGHFESAADVKFHAVRGEWWNVVGVRRVQPFVLDVQSMSVGVCPTQVSLVVLVPEGDNRVLGCRLKLRGVDGNPSQCGRDGIGFFGAASRCGSRDCSNPEHRKQWVEGGQGILHRAMRNRYNSPI